MFTRTKKGYIIVEAAIFMPVLIIGLCSLCFMIKYGMLCEKAYVIAMDETKTLMRDMYTPAAAPEGPGKLEERLETELSHVESADVSGVMPQFPFPMADSVKRWKISFSVGLPVHIDVGTGSTAPAGFAVVFRPFVGKDNSSASFESPEEPEVYREVWVFPKAGERYHTPACSFVQRTPRQMLLTQGVKLKYSPCKLCSAAGLPNGSVVYCFKSEGSKYHRASCGLVESYVMSMDKSDAEAKGYTPCKVCGGYVGN